MHLRRPMEYALAPFPVRFPSPNPHYRAGKQIQLAGLDIFLCSPEFLQIIIVPTIEQIICKLSIPHLITNNNTFDVCFNNQMRDKLMGSQVVNNMDAQKRLRQLMEERSWTEYRLAKESGLSQTTISNLFRRNNAPSLPTLEVICRAFGISLAQFFSESSEAIELTGEQRELFDRWVTLTQEQKKVLFDLIKIMT